MSMLEELPSTALLGEWTVRACGCDTDKPTAPPCHSVFLCIPGQPDIGPMNSWLAHYIAWMHNHIGPYGEDKRANGT